MISEQSIRRFVDSLPLTSSGGSPIDRVNDYFDRVVVPALERDARVELLQRGIKPTDKLFQREFDRRMAALVERGERRLRELGFVDG